MHLISAWIAPFLILWCRAACSSEWRRNHAYFWMANTLARPGIVSCRLFGRVWVYLGRIWIPTEPFELGRGLCSAITGAFWRFQPLNHYLWPHFNICSAAFRNIFGRISIYSKPHFNFFSAMFWCLFSRFLFLFSCVYISFQPCFNFFSAVF